MGISKHQRISERRGRKGGHARASVEVLETRRLLDGQVYDLGDLLGREESQGAVAAYGASNADTVTFRLIAPGYIAGNVRFALANSSGSEAVKLFRADGAQILMNFDSWGLGFQTVRLDAGDYRIRVARSTAGVPEGQDASYTLTLFSDYAGDGTDNDNGTNHFPRDDGVLGLPQSYIDYVGNGFEGDGGDGTDYYKFTVPTARRMQVLLEGYSTYYGFQIAADTDSNGTIDYWLTPNGHPAFEQVDVNAPAGTVYVVVGFGSNGATAPPSYTLKVNSPDVVAPPSRLALTTSNSLIVAGNSTIVTVTAKDADDNTVTSFEGQGTLDYDPNRSPEPLTFHQGIASISVTPVTT